MQQEAVYHISGGGKACFDRCLRDDRKETQQCQILSLKMFVSRTGSGEITIQAVDRADFEVRHGEFAVVLGPSGAGKDHGAEFAGRNGPGNERENLGWGSGDIVPLREKELNAYRRLDVGFVFQFYNLMPQLDRAGKCGIGPAGMQKSPVSKGNAGAG